MTNGCICEHASTVVSVHADEEVRWLPRRRASDIPLPGNNFFSEDPAALKLCAESTGRQLMPVSPSSSAQAAREAVAHRLRDLRKEASLTVVQLAAAGGWHYSKTSRIENALTGPSATDIRR